MKLLRTITVLVMCAPCAAAPMQIAGTPIEVSFSEVSGGRTVRIDLLPLDAAGRPKPSPESTVFVPVEAVEKLRTREISGPTEIKLTKLTVELRPQPLTLSLRRADGKLVQAVSVGADDGSLTFDTRGSVLGLGEGRQQFDRRGFYYPFVNGQTTFLATHSATIPVPWLIGTDGWAMFVHNPPPATPSPREANLPWGAFDLRGENAGPPPPANTPADALLTPPATPPTRGRFIPRRETLGAAPVTIYLSALERPADAMEEFVRLFGHAAMPPKWTLGYMQSHRSLAGPDEPLRVARTLRDKRLPCDVLIYLGTGYTNGQSGWNLGHGSLEFNPLVFPRPQEALDRLHALGFKVILHKNAAPATLHGKSVTEQSDDPRHISNYWATHVPLLKMGVDGFWPDDGDELPIEARLARHRLYYEGALKDRPGQRPWSLNRNGYAGAARYGAWIWSGDVQSRWVTLSNHVPVGLNFSLSVSPFWGSDIGGFFLAPKYEYTGELYARWFQFAAFTPLFRSHGRNWHLHTPWGWDAGEIGPKESGERADYPPESELHNAAVEPICRQYLELRYRLLPYNYTLVREACDTGLPPMRPMWLHYPADAEAAKLGSQYLWGRDLLVAPVTARGAKVWRVYLPAGTWHDWWTGESLAGGRWVERQVDLATLPLYVRAGAILPIDPVRQYTAQAVDGPTLLRVFPGADGTFTLYDDDGIGLGYQDGSDNKTIWLRMRWDDAGRRLRIEADERMKKWPEGVRTFEVERVGTAARAAPRRLEFRGEPVELEL